ncbi:hypothetical protein [Variovorax sp. dw_308]|uniref:hypothetical protein n=1 Tax=Variovorax sp. dw_308 TaxID=2721546 RepID=UPI001C4547CD|nr:hypothetical protein [Variovorax sp. dw_308]
MKQLFGYVLVKETNVGVPNLLVAAFDSRHAGPFDAEGRESPPNVALIQKMGRRLGSVLTDERGSFVINREDLEFQGNEARPNLMVAVFAPEDVQDPERPVPAPPEARLLCCTQIARNDAGAEEAFVIRLLQSQLDRFGIGACAKPTNNVQGERLGDSIENAWNVPAYLTDRFQNRILRQLNAAKESRDRAKEATKNLSAIPLHLRDRGEGASNFFQNNTLLLANRGELATKLAPTQVQAVQEGLTRLKNRTTPPVIRVWLTADELKASGLSPRKQGSTTPPPSNADSEGEAYGSAFAVEVDVAPDGEPVAKGPRITSEALTKLVRARMSGTDLVKKRGLNNPTPDELRRRYLMPPPPASASASAKSQEDSDKPLAKRTKAPKTANKAPLISTEFLHKKV